LILGDLFRAVIALLRSGQVVRPEYFESVTIFFSDLVGFLDFVEHSSPLTVMEFLHIVYSRFDAVVGSFDAYKVETIGDSYMVSDR
jgi:class 3 adenylate cyclase